MGENGKEKAPSEKFVLEFPRHERHLDEGEIFPLYALITEVYAMSEACKEILEEGLDRVFARHHSAAEASRKGLEGLGLELFVMDKKTRRTLLQLFSSRKIS